MGPEGIPDPGHVAQRPRHPRSPRPHREIRGLSVSTCPGLTLSNTRWFVYLTSSRVRVRVYTGRHVGNAVPSNKLVSIQSMDGLQFATKQYFRIGVSFGLRSWDWAAGMLFNGSWPQLSPSSSHLMPLRARFPKNKGTSLTGNINLKEGLF